MRSWKAIIFCALICAALAVPASADTLTWTGVNPGAQYFTFSTNGAGTFTISTVYPGTTYDTILTLFEGTGNSAIMRMYNDDAGSSSNCGAASSTYCSFITFTASGAGTWTIGLSQYSNFHWSRYNGGYNVGTLGMGWTNGDNWGAGNGNYVLTVSGNNIGGAAETPEPATLALLGTGLIGAALRRRKLKI